MAASDSTVGGYTCELFLSPVPEDFKCGLCKQVAREPNLTICCGEQFCKPCIARAVEHKEPCPSCKETDVTFMVNKRDQRRILALEVQCAMKDRGCEWTGTLDQLDAHLEVNSDNCQYVDVKCPNKCEKPVQKRDLLLHLAKECAKREFFCQYCNFTATYEVVCNDHWPECPFYPVPCPNGCEILAIERGDIDAHLILCSLEEVICDFSYAGCNVKLVREEMEKHLADNLQRHVLMMNKALQEKMEEKERKIEELEVKLEERDRQIQELRGEKGRDIQELREEKDRQIQELKEQNEIKDKRMKEELQKKGEQIREVEAKVARAEEQLKEHVLEYKRRFGITQFTVPTTTWQSPPMYTHPGGYKFQIRVSPNLLGYVAVYPFRMEGENDDRLQWPADCTITLQLLNQHRNQDHVTVTKRLRWTSKAKYNSDPLYIDRNFIPYKDLGWNAEKQTLYLKDNCLQFRITEIQVHSILSPHT